MRHSQNFNKIDSFLKPVLNIIVLRNVIAGWGERVVIKERAGIDLEKLLKVGESSIYQSQSWYYLGPFETLRWSFLRKLCPAINREIILQKAATYMFHWFCKTLLT